MYRLNEYHTSILWLIKYIRWERFAFILVFLHDIMPKQTKRTRSIARFYLLDVFRNNRRNDEIQSDREIVPEICKIETWWWNLFHSFFISTYIAKFGKNRRLIRVDASSLNLVKYIWDSLFFFCVFSILVDSPTFTTSHFHWNLLFFWRLHIKQYVFFPLKHTVKQSHKSAFYLYIHFIEFKISKIIFNLLVEWEKERKKEKNDIHCNESIVGAKSN